MLSASYLASCADDIVKLYSELDIRIICSIAKELKKMGRVTNRAEWQTKILLESGGLQETINKILAYYDKQGEKQLVELFQTALQKANAEDLKQITPGRAMSDDQKQTLEATVKKMKSTAIVTGSAAQDIATGGAIKVFSGLQRLTQTIATTGQNQFVEAANEIYMDVATGAFDYQTALENAVNKLAKKGTFTVEYTDSGKPIFRTIESAVRANVMTGINQTAAQQTLDNCTATGTDLVEVSAHKGARPEHAAFQGQVYCLNGERDYIDGNGDKKHARNFYDVCQPGEPGGICGINCRHSYYPYFEGTALEYGSGELSEMKDPKVTYTRPDGATVELSQYDAEQIQRSLERKMRGYKREAETFQVIGKDATAAREKMYKTNKQLVEFCKQTGLRRDKGREYIGTRTGKQPTPKKPAAEEK